MEKTPLETLIFEQSQAGRRAETLPRPNVPLKPLESLVPQGYLRQKPPALPEVSELEVMRHFVRLWRWGWWK